MTAQTRFALYFTSPAGSALARFGAGVLGYDCDAGAPVARRQLDGIDAAEAAAATAEPARYGFHGTLMAPFAPAPGRSVDELEAALAAFVRGRAPVPLGRLKVAGIGAFTALVPAGPEDAVRTFAGDCVAAFDGFRAPLSSHEHERRLAARPGRTRWVRQHSSQAGRPDMQHADHSHGIQPSANPDRERLVGRVLSVRGSQAKVEFPAVSSFDPEEMRITVGKFVGIRAGTSLLLGVVTDVALTTEVVEDDTSFAAAVHLDIVVDIPDYDTP